eukprot:EG_transcript_48104
MRREKLTIPSRTATNPGATKGWTTGSGNCTEDPVERIDSRMGEGGAGGALTRQRHSRDTPAVVPGGTGRGEGGTVQWLVNGMAGIQTQRSWMKGARVQRMGWSNLPGI